MGMELTGDALHLGPLLGHAAHLTRERMDARLSRYDVTPAQTHTLLYLCGHGDCAPQRDVVSHLRVKPSTANGILDRMEEKGLIRRAADENDQRQKEMEEDYVGLVKAGHTMAAHDLLQDFSDRTLSHALEVAHDLENRLFTRLTADIQKEYLFHGA